MTLNMDMQPQGLADFVDGENARIHRVRVSLAPGPTGEVLRIHLPELGVVDWPVGIVRQIPDQAAPDTAVFAPAGDHPARLFVKDRALKLLLKQACPHLHRRNKTPHLMRRLLTLSAVAVASVALIVFVLVPFMADRLAMILPAKGEQALGDSTYAQIRRALDQSRNGGLAQCTNPAGIRALDKMAVRLAENANIPYDLRLHVLDHKMVNAFALPGGQIVLFNGLLQNARSPEEVAGVLGHEMGHLARRDPTRLALRSAGSVGVLGLLLGDFAGGAAVLFLTEKLIQAQYSRGAEAAADAYSHTLLAASGLPTLPLADFFDRLNKKRNGDPNLLSHLANHPDSKGRSAAARAANTVGNDFVPILSAAEWHDLQQICKK